MELLGLMVQPEVLDKLVIRVHKDQLVMKGQQDPKEPQVHQEQKAIRVLKVSQGQQDTLFMVYC